MTQAKDSATGEAQPRYCIDLNWYQEQRRSFITFAASRLCPSCRKKVLPKSEAALLRNIKQCCSKREGFLTTNMPLREMSFRLLLANGNQPLELEQIQEGLQQWLGDIIGAQDISVPKLKRIIENDRYYGLRTIPKAESEVPNASPQSD